MVVYFPIINTLAMMLGLDVLIYQKFQKLEIKETFFNFSML